MKTQLLMPFLPKAFRKTTLHQFYLLHYSRVRGLCYTTFRKAVKALLSDKEFSAKFGKHKAHLPLTQQQFDLLSKELL